MDVNLSKLREAEDRGTWCDTVHGVARAGHDLVEKQLISIVTQVSANLYN